MNGRPWTTDEAEQLLFMRDELRMPWPAIADALGRTRVATERAYSGIKTGTTRLHDPDSAKVRKSTFNRSLGPGRHRDVPPSVLEERERYVEAQYRRSLTQTFFGDPPAGFSAQDRRR